MGDGPLFDGRRAALRERQITELNHEAKALIDALVEDLDSTGLFDHEIADQSGTERSHIVRVKARAAHPPQALVAFAIDHSRLRPPRYLVVLNAIGGYEPKPRPPPDVSEVFTAYRDEIRTSFPELDDVLRERVERRLGVVLAPARKPNGEG